MPTWSDKSESELHCRPKLFDEFFGVDLDGVSGELVLDVVEQVADGVHVLEARALVVHFGQHLVEVDGHVEQRPHVTIRVKSLQERPDLREQIIFYKRRKNDFTLKGAVLLVFVAVRSSKIVQCAKFTMRKTLDIKLL